MTFVRGIATQAALRAAALIGVSLSAALAQAAYVVTLTQQETSVVATGSGTLDLTGLASSGTAGIAAEIYPSLAEIFTGPGLPSGAPADVYTFFSGPTDFGSGGGTFASSSSGDLVGIVGIVHDPFHGLYVPKGYVAGSGLSDTSIYDSQTFSSLGVAPGTYVWTWGSGAHADSFTLNIGAPAVPERSTPLLLGVGVATLLLVRTDGRTPRKLSN